MQGDFLREHLKPDRVVLDQVEKVCQLLFHHRWTTGDTIYDDLIHDKPAERSVWCSQDLTSTHAGVNKLVHFFGVSHG